VSNEERTGQQCLHHGAEWEVDLKHVDCGYWLWVGRDGERRQCDARDRCSDCGEPMHDRPALTMSLRECEDWLALRGQLMIEPKGEKVVAKLLDHTKATWIDSRPGGTQLIAVRALVDARKGVSDYLAWRAWVDAREQANARLDDLEEQCNECLGCIHKLIDVCEVARAQIVATGEPVASRATEHLEHTQEYLRVAIALARIAVREIEPEPPNRAPTSPPPCPREAVDGVKVSNGDDCLSCPYWPEVEERLWRSDGAHCWHEWRKQHEQTNREEEE